MLLEPGLEASVLSSPLGAEFEAVQREAEARALGAELYRQAALTSRSSIEALSAVLEGVSQRSRGRLAEEVANGYARAMMADVAASHYEQVRLPE